MVTAPTRLDAEISRVLRRDACSGCGACCLLDRGLAMHWTDDGFLRPHRESPSSLTKGADSVAADRFRSACPGVTVSAAAASDVRRQPLLGPVLGVWRAQAADPVIRHAGSSGGAITALAAWLVQTGQATRVVGASAADDPRRTVTVRITTRAEALAAAGSRYAPVATAAHTDALDAACAVVGKPCEVSALRSLFRSGVHAADGEQEREGGGPRTPHDEPLLLSFFCAGTPSQHATDALVEDLGIRRGTALRLLRYRGHGWPGRFVAQADDGREVAMSYEESWGRRLGPWVQWRCKICPDGVGESSDITAGDLWTTDARGYPAFEERDGTSALIARTPRGLEVIRRAVADGALLVDPVTAAEVLAVQPFQVRRRTTLAGRLLGALAARRVIPRYRGFGLARLALDAPRESIRAARGTYRRVRNSRHRPAVGPVRPTSPAG